MLPSPEISRVKEAEKSNLFTKPNVIGVGVGFVAKKRVLTEEVGLVVLVRKKVPTAALAPQDIIPQRIREVKVDVQETGEIRALQSHTDRYRPAPGGVSIGHYKITAGTFGVVVTDRDTGDRLILSNNHVLANSNEAIPGDPVTQPGPIDGGSTTNDTIAHLERFCPLEFSTAPGVCGLAASFAGFGNGIANLLGSKHRLETVRANPQATNLVDAAVARPINESDILDEILEIGVVQGTVEAVLGMQVRKSGRTTELTTGQITLLNATIDVSYGSGLKARFENQLVAGAMSQGGDSGSLLVAGDELKAVGLLFAGSDQTTIFNPIQAVLDCLKVNI